MTSVIVDLQLEAIKGDTRVSDLLLRAWLVAGKLKQNEFRDWAEKELNGYVNPQEIPDYRKIEGQLKGWNPLRGWIPVISEDAKEGEMLSHRKLGQQIAELEHLVESGGRYFHVPLPLSVQRKLSKSIGFDTEFSLFVSSSTIISIISKVRLLMLDWLTKFDEKEVVGFDIPFTKEEIKKSNKSQQGTTNIYGANANIQILADNAQATQITVPINIDYKATDTFVEHVLNELPKMTLARDQEDELKGDIASIKGQLKSPKPKPKIIAECLHSIRNILEQTVGNTAAQLLLIELAKLYLQYSG